MPSNSAGGVFLPGDPPPATNMVLTTPTITGATLAGTITQTGTLTLSGTVAIAGTATQVWQVVAATSAGTTGSDATAIAIGAPGIISVTGASGAGIGLPVATAGAVYAIRNINAATGVQNVYAVGSTINGTTGTTALALSPTGTKAATLGCVTAGAWLVTGISTT